MSGPGKRVGAIGIGWYRPATFAAVRDLMEDRDWLPRTFQEFLRRAKQAEKQLRRKGFVTMRVDLDLEQFPRVCRENGWRLDVDGRNAYAALMVRLALEGNEGHDA